MDQPTAGAALRWLAHPVSLAAVALLAVNDHLLKHAFGSWWTGKLSDVAGLVFAPALLAVALAAVLPESRRRLLVPTCVLTVGNVFLVVKATAWGATTASAAWSVVGGPSRVLADPTDLLALPALAVAWHVGRRVVTTPPHVPPLGQRARTRAGTLLRWGLALPCAVLATAATAAPLDPSADAITHGPDGVVVVVDGAVYYGGQVGLTTADGATWTEVDEETLTATPSQSSAETSPAEPGAPACVPAAPEICYRPMTEHLGVERSADAGATWSVDWSVPDEVRRVLADRYGSRPAPEQLRTVDVAVLETAAGHVVVAANGRDGIAVRHEDAEWERLGFVGCCGEPGQTAVLALPGSPEESLVPRVAVWPVTGSSAAALAFVGLAWSLPGRTPRGPTTTIPPLGMPPPVRPARRTPVAGVVLLVAALVFLGFTVPALRPTAAEGQVDAIDAAVGGIVLASAPVLLVVALLLLVPRLRQARLATVGAAVAVGSLVACVVGVMIG